MMIRTSYTGDALPRRSCYLCGKPEHGSLACAVAADWYEPTPFCWPDYLEGKTLRVMNGLLFAVHPGSPP